MNPLVRLLVLSLVASSTLAIPAPERADPDADVALPKTNLHDYIHRIDEDSIQHALQLFDNQTSASTTRPTSQPTSASSTSSSTSTSESQSEKSSSSKTTTDEPTTAPTTTEGPRTTTYKSTTTLPNGQQSTVTRVTVIHPTQTATAASRTGPAPGLQTDSAASTASFARELWLMVGGAALVAMAL
ncbi:predicted protein [Aspergillus terreus NIH2624]|uniref:GPI anchored protein n=1 Tax=Aspergillus terreus (strain NIH 2624 / FGSC A1156) TaxID=341663 RepID=Q0CDT8_ASPTN|nr:uncharacterized protein ATEG_08146 [Aspergillus terreus NIH2624]EAU31319.1 predicted protein [Aspergillus terreus NIH2624]